MATRTDHLIRAASLADLETRGCMAVQVDGHTVALFMSEGEVHAVDNRCPHMGFPLSKGSVRDGILTCYWHYARFDLETGGTFDQWADDVRTFPVDVRDGDIYVDVTPPANAKAHYRQRLQDGLERNISLVIAKSAINLIEGGEDPAEPFRTGLDFGTKYRDNGWGQGLTIHAAMMNLLPHLNPEDRPRALYHGLSAVANDTESRPPRFMVRPLPDSTSDMTTLKRWFRRFIEVRDSEGAERCIISAIEAGASAEQLADMLFAAVTDHRYLTIGHPLDFTNKAFEALDAAGWEYAAQVLTSLVSGYASGDRMEESNAWRHPIDLIEMLEAAFEQIPAALEEGRSKRGRWAGHGAMVSILLGDDPAAIVDVLLNALREGADEDEFSVVVAYAAARRIAHFHTSNEFGDWDTALHTFTFASAVHQGLGRTRSPELLRGVFDAAMSIYLDRFLNIPSTPLPPANDRVPDPEPLLDDLSALLNRQQQVNEAGALAMRYLNSGGSRQKLKAMLGRLLLREDRDFHTIQCVEAAFRQADWHGETQESVHVLVAATRYLAAHAPTMRAQGQTYQIASRLSRGEKLFEEEDL
jgi:nitrite reductase/ring-hydroxylating ferredoxin subunit